jgi:hypothetical protein
VRVKGFQPVPLPAANVEVSIVGTPLTARTDADGRFVLGGVPAAQLLTLQAQYGAAAAQVVLRPNLIAVAGQTVDLGTLELADCLRTLLPAGGVDAPATTTQGEGGDGAATEQRIEPVPPSNFQLAPAEIQPEQVDMQPEVVDGGTE